MGIIWVALFSLGDSGRVSWSDQLASGPFWVECFGCTIARPASTLHYLLCLGQPSPAPAVFLAGAGFSFPAALTW